MKTVLTYSSEETINLGETIIKELPNEINVILLDGDLSAGKTTLTKGIGKALGVKDIINSPTFTILKTYYGEKTLHHLDLYRLEDIGSDYDLYEYIDDKDSIVVIEWPNQVKELLPKKYMLIEINHIDLNTREFKISVKGI